MEYVADFETTTDKNDCRVWAWCVCELWNVNNIYYGNSIESFIEFCKENSGDYYFHNAGFDCEFILHYLLVNGYEYSDKLKDKTYNTLISAQGKFYQMQVCFAKNGKKKMSKVVFKDSLKKLPMSVNNVAKAFKLDISKLEIDYEEYREIGHILTDEEISYIKNDVQIVALALQHQFEQSLTKLTIGSDALTNYKDIVGNNFKKWFPKLNIKMDAMIRKAYRGGWTYVKPEAKADKNNPDLIHGFGSVYDVNSLYPDVMYNCPMPICIPVYFHGQYKTNKEYPLYIQFLSCHIKLKKDRLPTIQIKNNPFFSEREYVIDSDGVIELALTSVDLDLLFKHYDVTVFSYNGGYMFQKSTGLFKEYIDYWMEIKENSSGGLRQIAKLMLNSLYGKFATNPDVTPKRPYLKDDLSVGYSLGDEEFRDPVYTPLGCFITAWARHKTITTAQSVYNRFLYADTDSIHVVGLEPVNIEVHPTKMGAWKHESNFNKSKYVRTKTYMERIYQVGKMVNNEYIMVDVEPYDDIKCAGMPNFLKDQVTFDNFKRGLTIFGKLRPVHCNGGIVLEKTTFTLT